MNDSYTEQRGSAIKQARATWARRKWLAVVAFFAPLAAAISLIMAMPNLYQSEVTVLVEQDPAAVQEVAIGGDGFEPRLQMISEQLLSRSRLQQLIERFDLYPVLRQHIPPQEVVARMRRDIGFQRKEVSGRSGRGVTVAFTLSYRGWDPQKTADVVNALASSYVAENEEFRRLVIAEHNERLRRRQVVGSADGGGGTDLLAQLKRELVEMQSRYSDRYPDVVQLKAEIAALERQREQAGTQSSPVRNAGPAPEPELPLIAAYRLQVLESALAPRKPVAPSRLRLMLIALVVSFAIAAVAVFLAEQFDTSFHRVDELWAFTHVPILTSVSRIVTRGDIWRRRLRFSFLGVLAISAVVLLVGISWFVGQNGEPLVWTLAQRGV